MSNRICSAVVAATAVIALTGCSNSAPVVGPESAADARPAARASVTGATDLTANGGLMLVASRVHDACGIDAVGTQPADSARNYRCGIGAVALFSVTGATAAEAVQELETALSANQCSSAAPLPSDPTLLNAVDNGATGAEAIEVFYECAAGGVNVHFGAAENPAFEALVPYLPYVPGGTDVEIEPAIATKQLAEARASGSNYVAVLEVSEVYFETDVCDGLHVCR